MILPATTPAVARERLSQMLTDTRSLRGTDGDDSLPADLTFSAGVACAPLDRATTLDALMIAADRLLYEAKDAGRARIECELSEADFKLSPSVFARQALDH